MSMPTARGRFHLAVRSLEFVRPHRRRLGVVVLLALLLAGASAADPLILKYLFDQIGHPGGLRAFTMALGGLVALELARATVQGWMGVWSWDVRLGTEYAVRERVVTRLNALPLAFHQEHGVGGPAGLQHLIGECGGVLVDRRSADRVLGYLDAAERLEQLGGGGANLGADPIAGKQNEVTHAVASMLSRT